MICGRSGGMYTCSKKAVQDYWGTPAVCCSFYFKGCRFSDQLCRMVDGLQLIGEAMPFEASWSKQLNSSSLIWQLLWTKQVTNQLIAHYLGSIVIYISWSALLFLQLSPGLDKGAEHLTELQVKSLKAAGTLASPFCAKAKLALFWGLEPRWYVSFLPSSQPFWT